MGAARRRKVPPSACRARQDDQLQEKRCVNAAVRLSSGSRRELSRALSSQSGSVASFSDVLSLRKIQIQLAVWDADLRPGQGRNDYVVGD